MEEKIAPLILTQQVNKKYPKAWEQVEDLRSMNGKELNWNNLCYAPIGIGINIANCIRSQYDCCYCCVEVTQTNLCI